jgi:hypothetical protein
MKSAVLGIAFALAVIVGVNYANAENGMVDFPQIPESGMIGQDVQVTYQTENRWTVTVTTQFQIDKLIEMPDVIYYPGIDGQIYEINVKEGFILANSQSQYNSANEPEPEDTTVEDNIAKKKAEIKEEQDEVWGKYNECLEQFKVENPLGFKAYLRIANLQPFEVPDGSSALSVANYSAELLKAEKKWQECEGAKKYKWIGEYEANKSIEPDVPWELDETNSPDTPEPVTQADKDAEEVIAAEFACSDKGKSQGLCISHFAGEIYEPKFPRLPAWYGQYLNDRNTDVDTAKAVADALQTQCDVYGPLYESKRGNESQYPEWLLHCPIPENDDE